MSKEQLKALFYVDWKKVVRYTFWVLFYFNLACVLS